MELLPDRNKEQETAEVRDPTVVFSSQSNC